MQGTKDMSLASMAWAVAKRGGWRVAARRTLAGLALAGAAAIGFDASVWVGVSAVEGPGVHGARRPFHTLDVPAGAESEAWREGLRRLGASPAAAPGEPIREIERLAAEQFAASGSVTLEARDLGVLLDGIRRLAEEPGGEPLRAWQSAIESEDGQGKSAMSYGRRLEAVTPWADFGLFRTPAERALDAVARRDLDDITPWPALSRAVWAFFGAMSSALVAGVLFLLALFSVESGKALLAMACAAPKALRRRWEAQLGLAAGGSALEAPASSARLAPPKLAASDEIAAELSLKAGPAPGVARVRR